MKVVIMAGGRGTRISSVASDIPKPMIRIGNKPVLEHEIECLKEQGFRDIIITVGYLGNVIKDYFGDGQKISPVTGESFGVNIEYYFENEPLGNAGALYRIKDKLGDTFLLLNGDVMFDIDFKRFIESHFKSDALTTIFTHPNTHPYDSGLIITDKNNRVIQWLNKEEERPLYYQNRVNAGLHVMSSQVLNKKVNEKKIDLDRHILKPLAETGTLYAYDSSEYVKDMGTPERYKEVSKDYEQGKIKNRNLKNKQKAIFLDRDGTINKHIGFLNNIDDFELLPRVKDAIRKINSSSYLAIVITNQPVVARGELTVEQLDVIHNKMETLLGENGAYIDALYYCPHHPHKGFVGEIEELKCECECRKPKPGMLYKAAEKFNIDLGNSWMIGDSENDMQAGMLAGCNTILISEKEMNCEYAYRSKDLLEAVEKILG